MSEIETKKCSKCGEVKPTTEFYKNIKAADGYDTYCKECRRSLGREFYAKKISQKRIEETNNALSKYTPRDLLTELKRRGYKWEKMYCLQEIKYENI